MTDQTKVPAGEHEQKLTLHVDIFEPDHADRVTTSLFTRTKQDLITATDGRCWICNRTAGEAGQPLEAHHWGVERCFAETPGLLWEMVKKDFPNFPWDQFDPTKPYDFVDNMGPNGQGVLLCKLHHTGELGVHSIPFPIWRMLRYLPPGYQISPDQVIMHDHT